MTADDRRCWECPIVGGRPVCDPSQVRCAPDPNAPDRYDERWIIHPGQP